MKWVFADAYYFIAMMNARDEGHVKAVDWSRGFKGRLLTTEWILLELAVGIGATKHREEFPPFRRGLPTDVSYQVVSYRLDLFEKGLQRYEDRADKTWSLTGCISFVATEEAGIADALTADHHFIQAGFNALLK